MIRQLASRLARSLVRPVSSMSPSSFNPEAYMRYPQFLHDINSNLTLHTSDVLNKGRLIYSHKCVLVENQAEETMGLLLEDDKADLRALRKACKGMFWQSDIDYTVVPCAFKLQVGDFTMDDFLEELGLNSELFATTAKLTNVPAGVLPPLPVISYQEEHAIGSINVYGSPINVINNILHKHGEVYHITIGENVINPSLQFVVAKTSSNMLIGIMSASAE